MQTKTTEEILTDSIAKTMNLTSSNVNITLISADNSSLSFRCQISVPYSANPAAVYASTLIEATTSGALTATMQKVASSYNYTALMTASFSSITIGAFILFR